MLDFVSVLQNFGFAALVLAAFSFGVWRVMVWIGTRIVPMGEKIVERHILFLNEIAQNNSKAHAEIIEILRERNGPCDG